MYNAAENLEVKSERTVLWMMYIRRYHSKLTVSEAISQSMLKMI